MNHTDCSFRKKCLWQAAVLLLVVALLTAPLTSVQASVVPPVQAEHDPCLDTKPLQQYFTENVPSEFGVDEHYLYIQDIEVGDYQAVLVQLQQMYADAPDSAYADLALLSIGETYADLQNYAQALATYEQYVTKYPDSVWRDMAQYDFGVAYYKTGDLTRAEAALQTLAQDYPDSVFLPCARQNLQDIQAGQLPVFVTDTYKKETEEFARRATLYYKGAQAFERTVDAGLDHGFNKKMLDNLFSRVEPQG